MSPNRWREIIRPLVQRSHAARKQSQQFPTSAEIRVHRLLAMERDEPPCRWVVLLFPQQHTSNLRGLYLQ